ncbi:MAG: peptidylprolyl isomerase [Polyangiaceae bacterium]|nr:peptidylprolyl isomerase [Polyangiaceae bacterium]
MKRWTSVVAGLLCSAALVLVMFKAGAPTSRGASPAPNASASASAGGEPVPAPSGSAGEEEPAAPSLIAPSEDLGDGGRGLPSGAPATVSFGVVLFTYQGVQFAPPGARSKAEALEKAKAAVEEAKKDFAEAVKKGDRGSTADAGRIPRGVLEADLELVLFSLAKGGVHPEPIDTPRGFWVVRRVE